MRKILRPTKVLINSLVIGVMAAAFIILSYLVINVTSFSIDTSIIDGVKSINTPFLTLLMTIISWVGYSPQSFVVMFVIILIVFLLGYRWEATSLLSVAVIIESLNLLFKLLIHRARPNINLGHLTYLMDKYSFPSGHVMFYTCFFGYICVLTYLLVKPLWLKILMLVIFGSHILLVGVSRIYLGDHWPSDVAGGYLLGGLCLIASINFYKWGKARFKSERK